MNDVLTHLRERVIATRTDAEFTAALDALRAYSANDLDGALDDDVVSAIGAKPAELADRDAARGPRERPAMNDALAAVVARVVGARNDAELAEALAAPRAYAARDPEGTRSGGIGGAIAAKVAELGAAQRPREDGP